MEPQNQNVPQQIPENSTQLSPTAPSSHSKLSSSLIAFIVIGFLVVGVSGYFLGVSFTKSSQTVSSNQQVVSLATPLPMKPTDYSITSSTNIAPTPGSSLPSGWTYKSSGECGVQFAIPPKEAPYYKPYDSNRQPSVTDDEGSGRFWDFPRGGIYPNLLSKFPNGYDLHKEANAMYAASDEAGGFISSAVTVSCVPNTSNYNNVSMLNALKAKLQEYNQDTGEKGMQASTYTIQTSSEVSRWNQKVYDLAVSEYYANPGGQPATNSVKYTVFATPEFIYEVRVTGATQNSFIKETAQKIFDNLSFQ